MNEYRKMTMASWQRTGFDHQRVAVSIDPFHNRREGFAFFVARNLNWKECCHVTAMEAALKLIAAEALEAIE